METALGLSGITAGVLTYIATEVALHVRPTGDARDLIGGVLVAFLPALAALVAFDVVVAACRIYRAQSASLRTKEGIIDLSASEYLKLARDAARRALVRRESLQGHYDTEVVRLSGIIEVLTAKLAVARAGSPAPRA